MEFQFLGTSSGVPTRQRNVSGLALNAEGAKAWYLVDCGEGTQHQLLRSHYSLSCLAAIFVTHVHGDHSFGLPGLLASAAMAGRREPLSIIAPEGVLHFVRTAIECTDMHLSYELRLQSVETFNGSWCDEHVRVELCELSHRVPSYAYCFTESQSKQRLDVDKLVRAGIPRGPLWGQLQSGKNVRLGSGEELIAEHYWLAPLPPRRVVIGGDNDRPLLLREACVGAQLLIHESTYTDTVAKKVGSAPQHSSAKMVAEFAQSATLPNLLLTHFSARYESESIEQIRAEAEQYFEGELFLAADLECYFLDRQGVLSVTFPGRVDLASAVTL